ncbi:MAG: hypothetical protein ACX94C_11720 [Phycisphaerales bacterium]
MLSFEKPDLFLDWLRERRVETRDARHGLQRYCARNRAWYLGIQWGVGKDVNHSPFSKAVRGIAQDSAQILGGRNGPSAMRTTLNKLTENTIAVASSTNPRKLDVVSTPDYGIGRPDDMAQQDVVEAVANAVIEDSSALSVIRRANFERCIDGMHGFGHQIETTIEADGRVDTRQRAFTYDAWQLILDPDERDQNLENHEYVVLSRVMTIHAARRIFGAENLASIDEKKLPRIGQLMSIEQRYNEVTGGAMFPGVNRTASAPGVVIHTAFLRGPGKRFDRMIVTADGSHDLENGGGRQVLNWQANEQGVGNPYGGVGMPLFALYGYPRPGELHGIADVAMQIDAQEKLNIAASIYFQSLWNYVQKVVLVDPRGFEDRRITPNQIRDQFRSGFVRWSAKTRDAKPPSVIEFPQPPQGVGNDIERFKGDVRQSTFRTDSHVGENKSHVSDRTVERSVELSEIASEDRVDADVTTYERFVESLVSTQVRLSQSGHRSPRRMMFEAGLNDTQFGAMMRVDPMRQLPRFKLSEEAIRRRSRSQKVQDINLLNQGGAFTDPTEQRRLYAHLDMPVSDFDRQMMQHANQTAAEVARGLPFEPAPLGAGAAYMIEALQRAYTQARTPAQKRTIIEAIDAQKRAESSHAEPVEPSIDEAVSAAFNPAAVRA